MENFNNKIKLYQFSEKYLIKNIKYFNSNICLEYQHNLSPYFCFRYLYNNISEPLCNRVYYNNIIEYFRLRREFNENLIDIYTKIFDICMNERINNKNKLNENKLNGIKLNEIKNQNNKLNPLFSCNTKCNDCIDKMCDY